jgi:hypothetical protein
VLERRQQGHDLDQRPPARQQRGDLNVDHHDDRPCRWLQSGENTIAVKVTQDNNTNTWAVNPTMFQAELTIPTQSP